MRATWSIRQAPPPPSPGSTRALSTHPAARNRERETRTDPAPYLGFEELQIVEHDGRGLSLSLPLRALPPLPPLPLSSSASVPPSLPLIQRTPVFLPHHAWTFRSFLLSRITCFPSPLHPGSLSIAFPPVTPRLPGLPPSLPSPWPSGSFLPYRPMPSAFRGRHRETGPAEAALGTGGTCGRRLTIPSALAADLRLHRLGVRMEGGRDGGFGTFAGDVRCLRSGDHRHTFLLSPFPPLNLLPFRLPLGVGFYFGHCGRGKREMSVRRIPS